MKTQWRLMYLGAFAALVIPNMEAAKLLADVTETDAEAARAIGIMRDASPGDRVYPALAWLRKQRKAA